MTYQLNPTPGVSNTTTGTTADAYAVALTLPCLGYSQKMIILKNTHATRGLTFKLDGYAHAGGLANNILIDVALVALDTYVIEITKPYASLVLSVKSTVASTPATYTIDHEMNSGGQ